MLEKYKDFIIKVLSNKEYLSNHIIDALINSISEIKKELYVSKIIIDEKTYRLIISIIGDDIFINSILTREYINNSFDGFIKEIYIDEGDDRFFKEDETIYYSSRIIKESIIENEYSSRKSVKEEKKEEQVYKGINSYNDLFKDNKIKTKNLF